MVTSATHSGTSGALRPSSVLAVSSTVWMRPVSLRPVPSTLSTSSRHSLPSSTSALNASSVLDTVPVLCTLLYALPMLPTSSVSEGGGGDARGYVTPAVHRCDRGGPLRCRHIPPHEFVNSNSCK